MNESKSKKSLVNLVSKFRAQASSSKMGGQDKSEKDGRKGSDVVERERSSVCLKKGPIVLEAVKNLLKAENAKNAAIKKFKKRPSKEEELEAEVEVEEDEVQNVGGVIWDKQLQKLALKAKTKSMFEKEMGWKSTRVIPPTPDILNVTVKKKDGRKSEKPVLVMRKARSDSKIKIPSFTGPRFDALGNIIPHSILGDVESFLAHAAQRREYRRHSNVLSVHIPDTRQKQIPEVPENRAFFYTRHVNQNKALAFWNNEMKSRRNRQKKLAVTLERPERELLMCKSYIRDKRPCHALSYGHSIPANIAFWKLPDAVGGRQIYETFPHCVTGYVHTPETSGDADRIIKEKGEFKPRRVAKQENSLVGQGKIQIANKALLEELDIQGQGVSPPVFTEAGGDNIESRKAVTFYEEESDTDIEMDEEDEKSRNIYSSFFSVKRESKSVDHAKKIQSLSHGKLIIPAGSKGKKVKKQGVAITGQVSRPRRGSFDFRITGRRKELVDVPALFIDGMTVKWCPSHDLDSDGYHGNKNDGNNDIGKEVFILMEGKVGEMIRKFVKIENVGKTCMRYYWMKQQDKWTLPIPNPRHPRQVFYFFDEDGVILPRETVFVPMLFRSNTAGSFRESWILQTNPSLMGGAKVMFTYTGMTWEEPKFVKEIAEVQNYLTKNVARTQQEYEVRRLAEYASLIASLRSNLVEELLEPNPEEMFMAVNPGMHYHGDVVARLTDLYKTFVLEKEGKGNVSEEVELEKEEQGNISDVLKLEKEDQGNVSEKDGQGNVSEKDGQGNVSEKDGQGNVSKKGGQGNVSEKGGQGNVSEKGGQGNVSEKGGQGNVSEKGGQGNVSKKGGQGNVSEKGGQGNVSEKGGQGNVSEKGGQGNVSEKGGQGNVSEKGGQGNVSEKGGQGNVSEKGGQGNVSEKGGQGNVSEKGGQGNVSEKGGQGNVSDVVKLEKVGQRNIRDVLKLEKGGQGNVGDVVKLEKGGQGNVHHVFKLEKEGQGNIHDIVKLKKGGQGKVSDVLKLEKEGQGNVSEKGGQGNVSYVVKLEKEGQRNVHDVLKLEKPGQGTVSDVLKLEKGGQGNVSYVVKLEKEGQGNVSEKGGQENVSEKPGQGNVSDVLKLEKGGQGKVRHVFKLEKEGQGNVRDLLKLEKRGQGNVRDVVKLEKGGQGIVCDLVKLEEGGQGNVNDLLKLEKEGQGNVHAVLKLEKGGQGNVHDVLKLEKGGQGNVRDVVKLQKGGQGNVGDEVKCGDTAIVSVARLREELLALQEDEGDSHDKLNQQQMLLKQLFEDVDILMFRPLVPQNPIYHYKYIIVYSMLQMAFDQMINYSFCIADRLGFIPKKKKNVEPKPQPSPNAADKISGFLLVSGGRAFKTGKRKGSESPASEGNKTMSPIKEKTPSRGPSRAGKKETPEIEISTAATEWEEQHAFSIVHSYRTDDCTMKRAALKLYDEKLHIMVYSLLVNTIEEITDLFDGL